MIRNLREEEVTAFLERYATEEVLRSRGFTSSPDLLMDLACWMLNRLSPRYVSSARGWARLSEREQRLSESELISVLFSGLDAFQRPSSHKAPVQHGHSHGWWTAPVFSGRVRLGDLRGVPEGAWVHLRLDDQEPSFELQPGTYPAPVRMNSDGSWTLWPDPIPAPAQAEALEKMVTVEVRLSDGTHSGHAEKVLFGLKRERPLAPVAGWHHRFPDLFV